MIDAKVVATAPNGITTAITYDAAGRITAQTDQKDGNTIQAFTQAFDAAGNLTSFTQSGLGSTTYAYDPLNRLTTENIAAYGSFYYAYDRVGNRIEHSNPNSYAYYTYNQANQLISKTENEQEFTYSYDASGNLTEEQLWGEPLYTYAYNGLDRLKEATSSANGITNTYTYDALGRRIARTQGTAVRNHHQFAASDLDDYITNENGDLFAALTRGTDGLATYTAFTASGPISGYHIFNPHGDTTAITQADGSVWFDYSYDAFGNALGNEGLAYDYAGKWERERDGLTGMVQMGVRDYDPVNGRFAVVDPLRGSIYKPQSRNRYEYAFNNPLVYQDLNGRFPDLIGGAQDFATEAYNANVDALTGAYYMTTHPGETADMWLEGAGIAKEHWEDVPEAAFDMTVGDPLRVMFGSDSTLYQRTEAGAMLALVLVPTGKAAATVAKCGSMAGKANLATMKAANMEARNAVNAVRLADDLRAQSVFTPEGKLSAEAIINSSQIMKAAELDNVAIPPGYAKYSTLPIRGSSGKFEVHYYKNPSTGEIYYDLDYKSDFKNTGGLGN